MVKTYTVSWRLDFEVDAKNRKAATEFVRRIANKLYATTCLSQHGLIECKEWATSGKCKEEDE